MIEVHLLTLHGHKPSEVNRKIVKFWLDDLQSITFSTTHIKTRMELLHSKNEYKFDTLPCLIVNDTLTKGRADKFYHDDIRSKAEEIKKKHPLEKRRKHVNRRVRDINGR